MRLDAPKSPARRIRLEPLEGAVGLNCLLRGPGAGVRRGPDGAGRLQQRKAEGTAEEEETARLQRKGQAGA